MLDIADPAEAVLDHFLGVGLEIAVGVAGLDQIRRLADQGAIVIQDLEGARQHQLVQEDGALVEDAVAIGILKDHDIADRLGHVDHLLADGIALHFDHPEPAIAVVLGHDRVRDQRVGCHQLHLEARRHAESLGLLLGSQRRRKLRLVGLHLGRPGLVEFGQQAFWPCLPEDEDDRQDQNDNDGNGKGSPEFHANLFPSQYLDGIIDRDQDR